MQNRLNQIILVVGRRGTGKTVFTIKKLLPAIRLKKLIVDVFDHPDYGAYGPSIGLKGFDKFNKAGKDARIYGHEVDNEVMPLINTKISNTCILFEDSRRYIEPNVQKPFKQLIIEHRNKNIDLIFQFHNLADVPPYLAAMYNVAVMFHTNDNLTKRLEKFSNWDELVSAQQQVQQRYKNPTTRYLPLTVRMQ